MKLTDTDVKGEQTVSPRDDTEGVSKPSVSPMEKVIQKFRDYYVGKRNAAYPDVMAYGTILDPKQSADWNIQEVDKHNQNVMCENFEECKRLTSLFNEALYELYALLCANSPITFLTFKCIWDWAEQTTSYVDQRIQVCVEMVHSFTNTLNN